MVLSLVLPLVWLDGAVLLRRTPEPGSVEEFRSRIQQVIDVDPGSGVGQVKLSMNMEYRTKTIYGELTANGRAFTMWSIPERVEVKSDLMAIPIPESENKAQEQSGRVDILNRYRMQGISGLDQMLGENSALMSMMQGNTGLTFPSEPVRVGTTWREKVPQGQSQALQVVNRVEEIRIYRGTPAVRIDSQMLLDLTSDEKIPDSEVMPSLQMKLSGTTTTWLAISDGSVLFMNLNGKLEMGGDVQGTPIKGGGTFQMRMERLGLPN
jgi:hypothetical protein